MVVADQVLMPSCTAQLQVMQDDCCIIVCTHPEAVPAAWGGPWDDSCGQHRVIVCGPPPPRCSCLQGWKMSAFPCSRTGL